MMRQRVKSVAEATLVRPAVMSLARRLVPQRTYILAYHNVVPDGAHVAGEPGLHLPQRRFAEHLDWLREQHEVVALDALLDGTASGDGRPLVAITFDDAYRGAVTAGVGELAARGLPATIFVAPAFIGADSFWWDVLAGGRALPAPLRRRAVEEHRGEDAAVRRWAERERLRVAAPGEFASPARESELAAALRHPGITLASHTWSHPNLTRLSVAEVEEEMHQSSRWLRERFARVIPWLSYPYGLCTREVRLIAARAGYRAALRVDGGGFRAPVADPYALPRLSVAAGLSMNGLALRLAGLVTP